MTQLFDISTKSEHIIFDNSTQFFDISSKIRDVLSKMFKIFEILIKILDILTKLLEITARDFDQMLGNTKSAQKWHFLGWLSIFRTLSCSYKVIYVNFFVLMTFAVILRHLSTSFDKKKRIYVSFSAYIFGLWLGLSGFLHLVTQKVPNNAKSNFTTLPCSYKVIYVIICDLWTFAVILHQLSTTLDHTYRSM